MKATSSPFIITSCAAQCFFFILLSQLQSESQFTAEAYLFGKFSKSRTKKSIYKRIFDVMALEQVLYEELEWKGTPLYVPDQPQPQQQQTTTVESTTTSTTNTKESSSSTAKSDTDIDTDAVTDNTLTPTSIPFLPLKAESTAVLIVDVQPEYWTQCPSVQQDFPNFETNLQNLITNARKQQAKIIWVRADYRHYHSPWLAQFERLNNGGASGNASSRPDTKSEIPCDPNSDEFAWEHFATPQGSEVVIAKKSWNSATNTALLEYLNVSGVENVLVCGLITSVCVQHSAFSVFEAGYRTLLVEDCCGDRGMARHKAAIALYGNYMYEITTSTTLDDETTGLQPAKPKWITSSSLKKRKYSSSVTSYDEYSATHHEVSDEDLSKRRMALEPLSQLNENSSQDSGFN